MTITHHNYEIYFIDYYDGKLHSDQIAALVSFLKKNPDLKEEFENYKKTFLYPHPLKYPDKSRIKKFDLSQKINSLNFEEFCIANLEGDLSNNKQEELKKFLSENLEFKNNETLFAKTKISPNLNIIFPNKHRLKKATALQKKIYRVSYTIAASILLFLLINTFWKNNQQNNKNISESYSTNKNITATNKTSTTNKLKEKNVIANQITKLEKTTSVKMQHKKEKSNAPKVYLEQVYNIPLPEKLQRIEYNRIHITTNSNQINTLALLVESQSIKSKTIQKKSNPIKIYIKKPTLYNIADTGIKGINKLTGSNMKLEKKTDEDGNLSAYTFNSKLISFTKVIKN